MGPDPSWLLVIRIPKQANDRFTLQIRHWASPQREFDVASKLLLGSMTRADTGYGRKLMRLPKNPACKGVHVNRRLFRPAPTIPILLPKAPVAARRAFLWPS